MTRSAALADMSEENIATICSVTGCDRNSVTLALEACNGDLSLAVEVLMGSRRRQERSYSERIGVPMSSLRFLYNGRRISDEATPGTLELESGDYIEVYNELGVNFQDQEIPEILEAVDSALIEVPLANLIIDIKLKA